MSTLLPRPLSTSLALVVAAALFGAPGAAANDNHQPKPRPEHFTVSVKMVSPSGRTRLIKVGDVKRTADGRMVATGVAAPKLDKMADRLISRWNKYKWPAKVAITDEFYSDSGMRPSRDSYTFTFTKKDALYQAAVVRKFVTDNGYQTLGLSTVDFIIHDTQKSKAKPGEIIYDEALKKYNFRKNTKMRFYKGKYSIIIYKNVRPANNGSPLSVLRPSRARPSLALAQNHDDGNQEIGRITIHDDGRITIKPSYARDVFESNFGDPNKRKRGVEIDVIEKGTWKKLPVARRSRLFFEAYVTDILEAHNFYQVSPKVDPVTFE